MGFRAHVGYPPFLQVTRAQPSFSGSDVVLTLETGGGESSYVATHRVLPFASVSGAVNDYADLGATAWTNASVTGANIPTTLGTWCARARAGTYTRAEPGVYIGLPNSNNRTCSFPFPVDAAATALNPIVLFAQFPAAYNYGSSHLYTEVRKTASDPTPTTNRNPVLGTSQSSNHVICDGFYADEALAPSAPSGGVFLLAGGTTGVQYRRCVVKRGNSYTTAGYNANAIYLENNTDSVVTDCYFPGRITFYLSNKRQTANIEVYDSANYLLKNNTHDGNYTGQYIKEDEETPSVSGRQCFNRFLNCGRGFGMQQGDNEADHNLVYLVTGAEAVSAAFMAGGPPRQNKTWNIHHNTMICGPTSVQVLELAGNGAEHQDCLFVDNICVADTGFTGRLVGSNGTSIGTWNWSEWTFDRNRYYAIPGTYTFTNPLNAAAVSGLTNWQALAGEANSSTGDPLFVNASIHDYRLQSGSPVLGKGCFETGTEEIGLRDNPTY